jgi:hypothetical protein
MATWGQALSGEQLPLNDCLKRLAEADLARIVLSVRALPVALPTRISLQDPDGLLLTSNEQSVAVAARRGDVISVQIDGLELDGATWSVIASGIASDSQGFVAVRPSQIDAVEHGATLYFMPLSVVAGHYNRQH